MAQKKIMLDLNRHNQNQCLNCKTEYIFNNNKNNFIIFGFVVLPLTLFYILAEIHSEET